MTGVKEGCVVYSQVEPGSTSMLVRWAIMTKVKRIIRQGGRLGIWREEEEEELDELDEHLRLGSGGRKSKPVGPGAYSTGGDARGGLNAGTTAEDAWRWHRYASVQRRV